MMIFYALILVSVHFTTSQNAHFNELNLPAPGVCGSSFANQIVDSEKLSAIDNPWLAVIKYSKHGLERGIHCDGVLINDKYILTAAHCVNSSNLARFGLIINSVRLGEDVRSFNCKGECDQEISISIAETITHAEYGLNKRHNDIALIRLAEPIKFSDYIRPICLPFAQHLRSKSYDDSLLKAAGFGDNEERRSVVKICQTIPGFNLSQCSKFYAYLGYNLNEKQLCAGEEDVKDNCNALPGGSLIAEDTLNQQNRYAYLVGIYSFGFGICGNSGFPGVYTRVDQYLDWILNHMKP